MKRISLFLIYALTFITTIIWVFYDYNERKLITKAESYLTSVAKNRIDQINNYFDLNTQRLISLLHTQKGVPPEIIAYFKTQQNSDQLKKNIKESAPLNNFENLYFISTEGNVIFDLADSEVLNKNLKTNLGRYAALAKTFNISLGSLSRDIEDTAFFSATRKPALFLTIPLFNQNAQTTEKQGIKPAFNMASLIGICSVQLSYEKIDSIAQNYDGLGKTGEIIIAKREKNDIVFVNNIRHVFSLNEGVTSDNKNKEFLQLNKTIKGQKIQLSDSLAFSIRNATLGTESTQVAVDYRNKSVVAVCRYLPAQDWAFVVKMDLNEILKPLLPIKIILIIIALILLLLIIFYGFVRLLDFVSPERRSLAIVYLFYLFFVCLSNFNI